MRARLVLLACSPILLAASCSDSPDQNAVTDMSRVDGLAPPDQAVAAEDLTVLPDLSAPPDLAIAVDLSQPQGDCVMHDPAHANCQDIVDFINQWLTCHGTCSQDNDCVLVTTHRGGFCRNACPTVANTGADGSYLQSLDTAFTQMSCGMGGCACLNPGAPKCSNGLCVGG